MPEVRMQSPTGSSHSNMEEGGCAGGGGGVSTRLVWLWGFHRRDQWGLPLPLAFTPGFYRHFQVLIWRLVCVCVLTQLTSKRRKQQEVNHGCWSTSRSPRRTAGCCDLTMTCTVAQAFKHTLAVNPLHTHLLANSSFANTSLCTLDQQMHVQGPRLQIDGLQGQNYWLGTGTERWAGSRFRWLLTAECVGGCDSGISTAMPPWTPPPP